MPPQFRAKGAFFVFLFFIHIVPKAQENAVLSTTGGPDSVIVSIAGGGNAGAPPVARAIWSGIGGQEVAFLFTREGAPSAGSLPLDRLVLAAIEQYLDDRIHFTKDGVRTDLNAARLAAGIDRLAGAAGAHFDRPGPRLSQATMEQLGRVCRIDWSRANFGIDGDDDQGKYLAIYFYVRAQRQELERQLRTDLIGLADVDVLSPSPDTNAGLADDRVPTVCSTVFDDDNYLCALDLKADSVRTEDVHLTDAMLSGIATMGEAAPQPAPAGKMRKRDRWLKAELDAINERIGHIDQRKELWAMRDRLDALEGRTSDLAAQVQELRSNMVLPDHPVAAMSALTGRNITLHFAKNSVALSKEQRQLLGEVARSMVNNTDGRLLITGFADPSGNPSVNLAISEARAKTVRAFFRDAGIAEERLLLNYFGDRRSTGSGADDRRVELQWLK